MTELGECRRCGFEECACLGGQYRRELDELKRIYTALSEAKQRIGMTETMSPVATIEAFSKQILLLRGDVLRLQARAKDPSGRWG